ncbi:hypothetical protein [Streptomyces sp. NBC_00120]|uniref:hypothetical protein n=1 Tax=Streptomyces sp. NBC_00120 TaxID=2975660 RepID=UPI00224D809B|nr:hypothetical protein [Streptomyces sp. NBC_00120]MCX5321446.1 hypothetical protein [Streptomyces sp. NBC_00120]
MGEFVIVTGDEVMAAPAEDPDATYTLAPLTPLPVSGSSPHVQVRGLPACVPDDIEKKLKAHSPMSPQRSQSLGAEPSPSNPRTLTSPGRPTAAGSGNRSLSCHGWRTGEGRATDRLFMHDAGFYTPSRRE